MDYVLETIFDAPQRSALQQSSEFDSLAVFVMLHASETKSESARMTRLITYCLRCHVRRKEIGRNLKQ